MTAVEKMLTAFDALPAGEQDAVIHELLRRHPVGGGELPDGTFEELADEVFRMYDAEEGDDATPAG